MKDPNTLENAVVELIIALETYLWDSLGRAQAETMDQVRPSLEQVRVAVGEILSGIKETSDTRTVEGRPVREAFEAVKYAVDTCMGADDIGPVRQALGEMLRALRMIDRELVSPEGEISPLESR